MAQAVRGKALVAKLRAQTGVRDPEALAAYLGRFKKARKAGMSVAKAKAVAKGAVKSNGTKSTPATNAPAYRAPFADVASADSFGKKVWGDTKLTGPEKNEVADYQMTGYGLTNPFLREGREPNSDRLKAEMKKQVKALDRVTQRTPTPEPLTVRRAVERDAFSVPLEELTGAVQEDKGFMSTTLLKAPPAEGMGGYDIGFGDTEVMMTLLVPAGTPAYHVPAAVDNPLAKSEQELLLGRGRKFLIKSATKDKGGKWQVTAEVLK